MLGTIRPPIAYQYPNLRVRSRRRKTGRGSQPGSGGTQNCIRKGAPAVL